MIRSALLALDNSPSSQIAMEMAVSFCQRYAQQPDGSIEAIHLTGVAVIDTPHIRYSSSMPIGAGAFKRQRDETLIQEANEKTEAILTEFETRCNVAGIPHSGIRSEGLPYEQIEKAAKSHDIILIGRDTNFHYETSESIGGTMRKLLADNSRPVIVYPHILPDNHRVVIAYDGSMSASHALLMWTLLEIRSDQTEIHVVSVNDDPEIAAEQCEEAAKLLRFHDCEPILHPTKRVASVVEHIADFVSDLTPRMVVLGAYGRGGWKEALFGSSTNRMLEKANCPLFLYK